MKGKKPAIALDSSSSWKDFEEHFPGNWREIARDCNLVKGLRQDKCLDKSSDECVDNLMHTLMLHLACNYSLSETSVKAHCMGLADITKVTVMNRLQKAGETFKELCRVMFEEVSSNRTLCDTKQVRLIDATEIKEPGRFGELWRLHYSFSLSDMMCDEFKLTKAKGAGTGESLEHFTIHPNDILVADRGLSYFKSFKHVAKEGGYSCVRWNSGVLPLYCLDGEKRFDIKQVFKSLSQEGMRAQQDVLLKGGGDTIRARVCIARKSDEAAERARRVLARKVSKKQIKAPSELARLACDFIVIITTLPPDDYPLEKVLQLYRFRWQIELVFKRFKSLAKLGSLPKYNEKSAIAWLYGKMFVALVIERISAQLGAFPPWRARSPSRCTQKLLARVQLLVAHRHPMDNACAQPEVS